jgi:hypothetical protein
VKFKILLNEGEVILEISVGSWPGMAAGLEILSNFILLS